MAMLRLQGAWSQLKICADQTAWFRRARLSPEPAAASQGRPGSGPRCSHSTGRAAANTVPPRDPVQGSAAPISSHGGRSEAPEEESFGSQSNVCEGNVTHPI